MSLKRFEDWTGSFYDYLEVGDQVDEDFYYYFINTLPPRTMRATLVQMGEPYSHIDGKPTFATISKENGVWIYKGNCFGGQSEEPTVAAVSKK